MSKIIVLSGHRSFNTGGVGTHLRVLSDELNRQQVDHYVSLGKSKLFLLYSYMIKKIAPTRTHFHFMIQVKGLKNILSKKIIENTQIVDCHDFASLVAAIELRDEKAYSYKVFYTVHAPFYEQYGLMQTQHKKEDLKKIKLIELKYLKKCDGFVCVDNKQKEIIENKLGYAVHNIVLPNAVNVDFLNSIKKNTDAEPYIIISRHLYRKCGVHIGIEAFSKAKIDKNIKLVIVGMGDEYAALVELTKKLGIEDRVIFKGRLIYEESINYTANALISLIPSIPLGDYVEATSLSMLEGMALGVPVIASNIGGLKQVLENSEAGILVEPNDADILSKEIENLVKDSLKRNFLAENAVLLINRSYSSKVWLDKRLKFFRVK